MVISKLLTFSDVAEPQGPVLDPGGLGGALGVLGISLALEIQLRQVAVDDAFWAAAAAFYGRARQESDAEFPAQITRQSRLAPRFRPDGAPIAEHP